MSQAAAGGIVGQLFRAAARIAAVGAVMLLLVVPSVVAQEEFVYRLDSGDLVRITVFGQPDLSGEFEVGSDGSISMPLIGDVPAARSTLQELKDAIIAKLKPDYLKNPQLSVEVANYRPFYIIGEVKNPGSYPYVGGMRVVNAVAMAGGFTYRAREAELLITRAGGDGEKEPAGQDTLVLPGDVIEVPERFF